MCCFYIDHSGSYRDRVHVYEVYKPLPWFANTSIHYSESRYPVAIKAAIDRYGAVPYVDLYRRGEKGGYDREVYRIDDPLFDRTELEDYRLASVADTLRVKTEHKIIVPEETRVTPVEQPVVAGKTERKAAYLAVKTNLLPWCTVVPSVRLGTGETKIEAGSFMPNLALECFLPTVGRSPYQACIPISLIRIRYATTGLSLLFHRTPCVAIASG